MVARTWLTAPVSSGGRDAEATARQQRRRRRKLGLAATNGQRRSDSKTAVTATAVAQIRICGRGCGKTAAEYLTTW